MKQVRFFLLILAIAAVLVVSGCGKKEKADTQEQTSKTAAEINIIPMKIENEPIVAFKFVFHTGSMDDPEGKNGLAYLTAQMLAKGGTQNNSYQTILEKLFPQENLQVKSEKSSRCREGWLFWCAMILSVSLRNS